MQIAGDRPPLVGRVPPPVNLSLTRVQCTSVHPQRFLLCSHVATFVPPALFHKTEEILQHTDKRVTGRLFLIALEASDAGNYK